MRSSKLVLVFIAGRPWTTCRRSAPRMKLSSPFSFRLSMSVDTTEPSSGLSTRRPRCRFRRTKQFLFPALSLATAPNPELRHGSCACRHLLSLPRFAHRRPAGNVVLLGSQLHMVDGGRRQRRLRAARRDRCYGAARWSGGSPPRPGDTPGCGRVAQAIDQDAPDRISYHGRQSGILTSRTERLREAGEP